MNKIILLLVSFTTALTVSCKKAEDTSELGEVGFLFNHKVGSQALEFNKLNYINASGHKYEIRTLKYFISNITFFKPDGGKEVYLKPIYLDAQDSSTLRFNEVKIPLGVYSSIGFTFGIDSIQNISGALNTIEEVSMSWPEGEQGGGYHYMKLEGTYDSLGLSYANKNYKIHTGPTMGNPYDFNVLFDNSAFTLNEDGVIFNIIMDINEWFTKPNIYDFTEYGHMIMMNKKAQNQLKENGPSAFSLQVD